MVLPALKTRTKKPTAERSEINLVFHRSLFKQKKTEGPQKISKIDPSDKVHLPKIDDRVFNPKKRLQVMRDEQIKICDRLETVRKIYAERKVDLCKQWDMLEEHEMSLGTTMQFYNQFVRENVVKRERFQDNMKLHTQMIEKYKEETESMKTSISELDNVISTMKHQIRKHHFYQTFLEKIVSPAGEFKSLLSLITRFELLYTTSLETSKSLESKKVELENILVEMTRRQFDYENQIQSLMNKLGGIHKEHVKAFTKSSENEQLVRDVKIVTLRKRKDIVNTLETMNNLYLSICKKQGVHPCYENGDYDNQLLVINTEMNFLDTVIRKMQGK